MIESDLLNALNDSIDRMAGGATVAECLQRYPQYAASLESLLETGLLVRRAQPSIEEAEQGRVRQTPRYERLLAESLPYQRTFPVIRWAQWAAALMLAFGLGSALLAEQSIPGDALYGVKLFTEDVRASLVPDAADTFAQRRFDEARRLTTLRREAELTLTGPIDSLTESLLVIEGLAIAVDAIPERDSLMPGMRVEILAQSTVLGELRAVSIRVLETPDASSQPLAPTFTPSPTASNTPEPTGQATRANTLTPARTPPAPVTETSPSTCRATQPSGWITYIVQPGESLSALAARTGSSVQALADANCLPDSRLIVAGQPLYVPREPARLPTLTPTAQPLRPTDAPAAVTREPSEGERPRRPARPTPEEDERGERGGR